MKEEYNQLIALFGSLDKDEQESVLQDLKRIAEDKQKPPEKHYREIAEALSGCGDIRHNDKSRKKAYARVVVAYEMMCDGYSELDIGRELHRDHSTVHHYKVLMKDAMQFPKAYPDLIKLHKQYKNLLK